MEAILKELYFQFQWNSKQTGSTTSAASKGFKTISLFSPGNFNDVELWF